MHAFVVLLHVDLFRFQHTGFDSLFTEEFDQCLIFRQCFVAAEQSEKSFFHLFLIIRVDKSLSLR